MPPFTTNCDTHGSFLNKQLAARIMLALVCLSPFAQADAQVAVSNDGTPSYSLPIAVPPGIAGMAPNLGLLYSSRGINGPVGQGWTVQGISLITRCQGNKAIDGVAQSVGYNGNDKLCLDGQRLIQTTAEGTVINGGVSNPGPNNPFQQGDALGGSGLVREYRTSRDIYARIRGYGAAGGNPANGPQYFKVWTKSGQIYEYGVNSNASSNALVAAQGKTAISAWPVSRISDTVGNYIDFQYEQRDVNWGSIGYQNVQLPGHEWNLSEVRYTGNGTQQATSRVVFTYVDRPDYSQPPYAILAQDRSEAFHQGSKNVSIRLLDSVRTWINWPANVAGAPPAGAVKVKTYQLSYDHGPVTNRSRLTQIKECAGNAETACLPPTKFNYAAGGGVQYTRNTNFRAGGLATLQMLGSGNGVLTGNFFGSGRSDILRWSDSPNYNQLYRNNGDGNFSQAGNFNILNDNLFKNDGCYSSIVADFNGDGLSDILRYSESGSTCNGYGVRTLLFTSNGDGSFNTRDISTDITGIDFSKIKPVTSYQRVCDRIGEEPIAAGKPGTNATGKGPFIYRFAIDPPPPPDPGAIGNCTWRVVSHSQSKGASFSLVDVNGDGILDIVTTILPAFGPTNNDPDDATLCAGITCTRVFVGQVGGGFSELSNTNLKNRSVYVKENKYYPVFTIIADMNGDGLSDLLTSTGVWLSQGDGNFITDPNNYLLNCRQIDFNGDGRSDCMALYSSDTYSGQNLNLSQGKLLTYVNNFNLTNPGQELQQTLTSDPSSPQKIGSEFVDIDGDGRTDILRWKDDPSQNRVYLSNGDGTFRESNFNLNTSNDQLRKSDLNTSFILGDFTGRGNAEILRITGSSSNNTDATVNVLYVKSDPTPVDQLVSVTSGTGLTTALTWVPMSNSSSGSLGVRYQSDRGTPYAASYPFVDLTTSSYVVATMTSDTGVAGSRLNTEYKYNGLKVAVNGLGWQGFREVLKQNVAPNGDNLTVSTQYLQDGYHANLAGITETRTGTLNASAYQLLSRSIYVYCDKTAAPGAENTASWSTPCPTTAKVQRPYLLQSTEFGNDPAGGSLPTVTTNNVFNNSGDPTKITVTTTGVGLNGSSLLYQTFSKVADNIYNPDNIAGDSWILGRLQKSIVTNTVPNDLGRISVSYGTAPNATATQGTNAWPALTLSNCSSTTPTAAPTPATTRCTLNNTGTATAASISYAGITGATVSGPTSACVVGVCGVVTVTTDTKAGTYTGILTATPANGTAASIGINLVVNASVPVNTTLVASPLSLAFGKISGIKTLTLTVSNTGTASATGSASVNTTNANAGNFSITGGTCSNTIPANSSCTVQVSFDTSSAIGIAAPSVATSALANGISSGDTTGTDNACVGCQTGTTYYSAGVLAISGGNFPALSINLSGSTFISNYISGGAK